MCIRDSVGSEMCIRDRSNHHTLYITIVMMLGFIVVFFAVFWLFYRLIYGILLRKLHRNYKELQKIDL
jgi:dolichyl-phosphate-mannose--protein O-mannosyl transferase